tara:strand:- start:276 stop:446 length:171 start_codon:yes stop_codon:yes gene_type:complete
MNEIRIKQTCFYKVKVSDDIKEDRILESINVHPVELLDNAELYDINTIIMEEEYEN